MEQYLIEHCSPTLASIKTASLFTLTYMTHSDILSQLSEWNLLFKDKGVTLRLMKNNGSSALIYVYRPTQLEQDLQKPGVNHFLQEYGYTSTDLDYAVNRLQQRLSSGSDFPHEIGLFLSYPLGDVQGFIENAGSRSKCSGCWKVYCNECDTVRLFARLRKCREIYMRLWGQGKSILQLTVAA